MSSQTIRPDSYYVGRWFRAESHLELGFGFCKGRQGDKFVLAYVDVPAVAEHDILVSREHLIEAKIPEGTRVWIRDDPYGWRPGEVRRQLLGNQYEVSIVDQSKRERLRQDEFKLRWSRPLENPVEAVANGLADSPVFYEARSALLSELVKQRAVCRGLTAALSAPIGLFQHQMDTAARVLADPVMRYLLADEVGLGKTIEAGIVIRQFLLDDPQARVLVLCPETLVRQWNSELSDRLGLHDALRSAHLRVAAHSVLRSSRSQHWLAGYDFIVIDEAHNVLPLIESQSELEQWLRRVDCLLALSATPMRGDLETFRRLLALVDPVAFSEMTFETFCGQLQERERNAIDVQVLSTRRASLRQKAPILDTVAADFAKDEVVTALVAACRASEDAKRHEWQELADYLREVYRLSRRMIRHRRNSDVTDSYKVAGRVPNFIDVAEPARPVIDDFLESYGRNLSGDDAELMFAMAVLHGLAGPVAMNEFFKHPRSDDDRTLFEMTSARMDLVGTTARLRVAADVVFERIESGNLVVVASAFSAVVEKFGAVLIERGVASHQIHHHYKSMTAAERDDAIDDFLAEYRGGALLADNSVEEGRNLQEAHVLVNLDMPLDINQLEQRIGRLDRYAVRPEPAEVVVFLESNSKWVSAHIELLRNGIGVFDTSVSTVQRLLTDVLDSLLRNLLLKGAEAFELNIGELRRELETERDNIDLLEELESVEAAAIFTPEAFGDLIEYELSTGPLREAVRRLTTGTGSLALKPVESADGVLTFGGTRGLGLSADEAFSLERLLQPKAFERSAALANPGVSPFRIGDSLVDWLENFLRADERGRASAFARSVAGLEHPALWLHCEFIIEFDSSLPAVPTGRSRRRLARRAEAHLQPIRMETWTDASGPASDDMVESQLSRPFDARFDKVLRGQRWVHVLDELPAWASLCNQSADVAWDQVVRSALLESVVEAALQNAQQDIQKRLSILEARKLRSSDQLEQRSIQDELDLEKELATALVNGIREPAIRLVACGVCLLWPEERF